jgi:hypothetical protein
MPHAPVVAGTFVCYVLYQEELLGAQNIYLHQAELLDGQSLINNRLTLNIISTDIIQLEIMQIFIIIRFSSFDNISRRHTS